MTDLDRLVGALLKKNRSRWELKRGGLCVSFIEAGRSHKVQVRAQGDDAVLSAIVLREHEVTRRQTRWSELAILAWQRNAEHELVTFGFDNDNRLIGQIRHPLATLEQEELEIYIETLARECDRFEYLLTGEDRE